MTRRISPSPWRQLDRLRRCRRGAIAVALAIMLPIVLAGVMIGVEGSRLHQLETRLQIALDAAALAGARDINAATLAADVRQVFDANFDQDAPAAEVTAFEVVPLADEHGVRRLQMSAAARLRSPLGGLLDAAELDWLAVSAANRTIRKTQGMELALVLDNTGSMRGGDKIGDLRTAAQALVDALFDDQESKPNLWVAVVPYAASVNVGRQHMDWLRGGAEALAPFAAFGHVATRPGGHPLAWKGCVLARADGADETDATPIDAPLDPLFWPSSGEEPAAGASAHFTLAENVWPVDAEVDERNEAQNNGFGPNLGCGSAILPLTSSYAAVSAKVAEMQPWHRGGTMANVGLVWGWRTLSPAWRGLWRDAGGSVLETLPLDYEAAYMSKVIVLMTDGANGWYRKDYTAYRFPGDALLGGVGLDARMLGACSALKREGIVLFTITFGAGINSATAQLYSDCASTPEQDPNFPGPKYFDAPTAAELDAAFKDIAGQLTELRLTQ
jgi:Flp pilus assembly protein TadG